jgi:hypothetical protein
MLQELGYEKQPKYFGTQVTYESPDPVWHVQVYIFTPKPLREDFEIEKIYAAIAPRCTFHYKKNGLLGHLAINILVGW